MPLSGEILEFNTALEDTPEAVNEDPYELGWMIKIKMNDPTQLNQLLNSDRYKQLIEA
jgi:glycine cleavage system H protein